MFIIYLLSYVLKAILQTPFTNICFSKLTGFIWFHHLGIDLSIFSYCWSVCSWIVCRTNTTVQYRTLETVGSGHYTTLCTLRVYLHVITKESGALLVVDFVSSRLIRNHHNQQSIAKVIYIFMYQLLKRNICEISPRGC